MLYSANKFERVWAHLFLLFFIAQILSPYVAGKTIYLEILIAIINPFFWIWCRKQTLKYKYLLMIMVLMSFSAIGHFDTALKLLLIFFSVIYIFYLDDKKILKIEIYISISIGLAILQFIFTFIDPITAGLLGPTNISSVVWGNYATPTYTNFYTVFLFPRVSGLSREAGFFASLIVTVILYMYIKKNKNIYFNILLLIGYIISFSKMSMVLFPLLLLDKIKKLINKIPILFGFIIWIFIMIYIWNDNINVLLDPYNTSFLHRFGGYVSILDLNIEQILFGVDNINVINSFLATYIGTEYTGFAGLAGTIIYNGIIVITMYIIALYFLGISTTGFFILLLLTLNVSIDSNQNFVILTYFIVFKYYLVKNVDRVKCFKEVL